MTQTPDANFTGLAVEECRWLKTETGRKRVWSVIDGGPVIAEAIAPRQAPAGGRPSTTRTHFEIRVIKGGKKTALDQRAETPNEAKALAAHVARAIGDDQYHELDSEEDFAAAAADRTNGVYLVPCKTQTFATAI